ncbi:beta-1,3-galactosyltransferase 4-like [Haliotis asinina]|uniref:beta-1,3-galactosyltransferase 4-like n=1 Tax=Haliotis asinina TaxID=109174 RepID=UPI003531D3FE
MVTSLRSKALKAFLLLVLTQAVAVVLFTYHTFVDWSFLKSFREFQWNMPQDLVETFGSVPQRQRHTQTRYATDLSPELLLENRTLCPSDRQLSILFMVHSGLTNWKRRDTMRRILALGNSSLFTNYSTRVLFLLGRTAYAHVKEMTVIRDEFAKHGDILQGNFIDSYRNLTYKGSMGIEWFSRCIIALVRK